MANTDILLINIDTAGSVMWSKTYGGVMDDYGNAMTATSDSNVVIGGQTYSYGVASSSGYVLKINSAGNITWSVTSSIASPFIDNSLLGTNNTFDGGYIFTGYCSSLINTCIWILKVDAFGNVISSVEFPGSPEYKGYGIKSIPGGDFIVAGKQINGTDPGSILVMKINPLTFTVSFLKIFSSNAYEAASNVVLTPDGNFALVGTGFFGGGSLIEKGFLIKLNLSGNFVYLNNYQPLGYFSALNSIIVTHDNNLLLTGKTISAIDSSTEVYIIKVQLGTGTSGCFENPITYTITPIFPTVGFGSVNNFGGTTTPATASMIPANVLQNDICGGIAGFGELASYRDFASVDPNPSDGNITIHFNGNTSEKSVQIFDVTGNIIYEKNKIKNSEEAINLTGASKSIYFLKVFDENKISTNKIVIQ